MRDSGYMVLRSCVQLWDQCLMVKLKDGSLIHSDPGCLNTKQLYNVQGEKSSNLYLSLQSLNTLPLS